MKTRECDVGGAVRLPKQFYERPLTLEESRFASEHISSMHLPDQCGFCPIANKRGNQ